MPSYLYWKKTVRGKSITVDSSLDDVLQMTERKQFAAEPVDEKDLTSAWLTGRPKAIKAVKKILGKSDYEAHAGCYTGGANGVYWMDIIDKRADGLVIISNITEGAKRKVESIQIAIEPDLLYPLLRGRDVKRWRAEPSAYILMAQDPDKRRGIDENEIKTDYPKSYLYLKRFEEVLRERAAYKRYFDKDDPFYSMFDVGDYTFSACKVVWKGFGVSSMSVAVVGQSEGKSIMTNQAMHPSISLRDLNEAHYICAFMNSAPFNFAVQSHTEKGGKSFAQSNILKHIYIPKFNSKNEAHQELAGLSQSAHYAKEIGDEVGVKELEQGIDELAAQIWELTKGELKEIQESLAELK